MDNEINNKRFVFTHPETGKFWVIYPAPQWLAEHPDNTLEECARRSIPEGVKYRMIDQADLPGSETHPFRNAWTDEYDTPTVDVHMGKAREIHLDRLRLKRDKKLKELDIHFMKHLEDGDTENANIIAKQKKELRDMPILAMKDMSQIDDADELHKYIPDILKDN